MKAIWCSENAQTYKRLNYISGS